MLITNPAGKIAVVHTLVFKDAEERSQFHEYANKPDGLPVARGAPGNMFVSRYDSCHTDYTAYMFRRGETAEAKDAYSQQRKDISPDWFLPMMDPQYILRFGELDSNPTINSTQAPLYGAREGTVCNFHIWQFEEVEFRNGVNKFGEWDLGFRHLWGILEI